MCEIDVKVDSEGAALEKTGLEKWTSGGMERNNGGALGG